MEEHEENNNEGDGRYGCFGEDFLGAYDLTEHLVPTFQLAEKCFGCCCNKKAGPPIMAVLFGLMYIATDAVTYVEGLLVAAEGIDDEENGIGIAGKITSDVSER